MTDFERLCEAFPEGTRVRFPRSEERPNFTVPKGSTGTVTEVNATAHYVRVDQYVEGLTDSLEWFGEFVTTPEDEGAPFEPTDVAAPAEGQVLATVPFAINRGMRVGELTEVLQALDPNAEIVLTVVEDRNRRTSYDVQAVWRWRASSGEHVELAGFAQRYDPAEHQCPKCGGLLADQGAQGYSCGPCSDAEIEAVNAEFAKGER